MAEIREVASKFEAKKIGMVQSKDGHVLKLVLHWNDLPQDVIADHVGTRYMVALVRLNDQDEPVQAETDKDGALAVKIAGTLCSDENFQAWCCQKGFTDDMSEEASAAWMRGYLEIKSRAELKINKEARVRLTGLRAEFIADLKGGFLRR